MSFPLCWFKVLGRMISLNIIDKQLEKKLKIDALYCTCSTTEKCCIDLLLMKICRLCLVVNDNTNTSCTLHQILPFPISFFAAAIAKRSTVLPILDTDNLRFIVENSA